MELKQVCEEGKHWFAFDGENLWPKCPYCKTKMHIQADIAEWEKKFTEKLKANIKKGMSRGKIIDTLPKLPWFSDAINEELNDPNQKRSHEVWLLKDAKELSNLFAKYGISTHNTWCKAAESIGRSLYAVERQLRIIIANKECKLDELFPEEVSYEKTISKY